MTMIETQPRDIVHASSGSVGADVMMTGGAMTQVRTAYTTAVSVQRPRRLATVLNNLLAEADLAGEGFYYGWGKGKDRIEGANVKLALAAARCYGNCAIEQDPVVETIDAWIFTAKFIDLETGFTLARQFRQSKKSIIYGKHDEERKTDIRFQVGQSKAIRNVVLNALPTGLATKAIQRAKDGVKASVEDFVSKKGLPVATEHIMRALAKVGVKEPEILARLGIADRKAIDVDMIVDLKGCWSAIDGGQEYADDLFPPSKDKSDDFDSKVPTSTATGFTPSEVQKPAAVEEAAGQTTQPASTGAVEEPNLGELPDAITEALSLPPDEVQRFLLDQAKAAGVGRGAFESWYFKWVLAHAAGKPAALTMEQKRAMLAEIKGGALPKMGVAT